MPELRLKGRRRGGPHSASLVREASRLVGRAFREGRLMKVPPRRHRAMLRAIASQKAERRAIRLRAQGLTPSAIANHPAMIEALGNRKVSAARICQLLSRRLAPSWERDLEVAEVVVTAALGHGDDESNRFWLAEIRPRLEARIEMEEKGRVATTDYVFDRGLAAQRFERETGQAAYDEEGKLTEACARWIGFLNPRAHRPATSSERIQRQRKWGADDERVWNLAGTYGSSREWRADLRRVLAHFLHARKGRTVREIAGILQISRRQVQRFLHGTRASTPGQSEPAK